MISSETVKMATFKVPENVAVDLVNMILLPFDSPDSGFIATLDEGRKGDIKSLGNDLRRHLDMT